MTKPFLIQLFVVVILIGCKDKSESETENQSLKVKQDSIHVEIDSVIEISEPYVIDTLEQKLIDAGLIDIQSQIPSIFVDLKYSSTDNFMGQDVYGYLGKAYLQPDVVEDLKKCIAYLQSIDSSYSLLIYDAVRPRSVQQIMWDILDMPIQDKTKFVSNPKNGSVHNYGAAVDITICNSNGEALDMGAGYDDIRLIAYPKHEQAYLDSGMLSQTQIDNRNLLRATMRAGGFSGIQTEWWHFNRYSRDVCKTKYQIIE